MGKIDARHEIRYSNEIAGTAGNHKLAVRFDDSHGYIGINQWSGGGEVKVIDRVLLTRAQAKALVSFINHKD